MHPLCLGSDEIALALRASIIAPLTVRPLFGGPAIAVPRYAASLTNVTGRTRFADYGKRAAARLDDGLGYPTFAELLVAQRLRQAGWVSAWASVYQGLRYVESWPWDAPEPTLCPLPPHVLAAVDNIADIRRSLTGGAKRSFGGILDVIAWRKTEILMVECKQLHKDRLQRTQEEWMHCALLAGIRNLQLGVFEWQVDDSTKAPAVVN